MKILSLQRVAGPSGYVSSLYEPYGLLELIGLADSAMSHTLYELADGCALRCPSASVKRAYSSVELSCRSCRRLFRMMTDMEWPLFTLCTVNADLIPSERVSPVMSKICSTLRTVLVQERLTGSIQTYLWNSVQFSECRFPRSSTRQVNNEAIHPEQTLAISGRVWKLLGRQCMSPWYMLVVKNASIFIDVQTWDGPRVHHLLEV